MFGIGTSEFFIIALVIIIFVKPKDLPRVFRFLGKIAGKAKAAYDEAVLFKDQIISEIDGVAANFDDENPAPQPNENAHSGSAVNPAPNTELTAERKHEQQEINGASTS